MDQHRGQVQTRFESYPNHNRVRVQATSAKLNSSAYVVFKDQSQARSLE